MRIKSDIFVAALLRRVFSQGDYAAVLRKGAAEAGAIFIRIRTRAATESLYAPAPQSYFDEDVPPGRLFEARLQSVDPQMIDDALAREIRFDPDCWILELEVEGPGDLFDIAGEKA